MADHAAAINIAASAAASVQALADALQQQTLIQPAQHKITLPNFWAQDPPGWFHHIEAEFILARVPLSSYHCYLHVVRALPADIVASVHDLIRTVTAETTNAYNLIKRALLSRFTSTPLQQCHKLLDYPQLGDDTIATQYAKMRALYPPNSDILFNAIFLRTLPENVRSALASCAELPSDELAEAAIQLQHTIPPLSAIAAATPLPPSPTPARVAAAPYDARRPSRDHRRSPYRRGTPAARRSASRDSGRRSGSRDGRRRSASRDSSRQRLCWYHESFGKRARHCQRHECDWGN